MRWLFVLDRNTWNYLTVRKQMISGSYKSNVTDSFTNHIKHMYMYKEDLALNNLQVLICRKIEPNLLKSFTNKISNINADSKFFFKDSA